MIEWRNFTDPQILTLWIEHLFFLVIFLFLLIYVGSFFVRRILFINQTERLVYSAGIGMCALSFLLFFFGLFNLYNPLALSAVLMSVISVTTFLDKGFQRLYETIEIITSSFKEYYYLWIIFLIYSITALFPPHLWDATSYHLPYMLQWAQDGGFTIDPSMRYPIYTFNFNVLYIPSFLFNNIQFPQFICWLIGALNTLLIITFLESLKIKKYLACIAGLGFFFTPAIKITLTSGYIDLPIIFFVTLSACLLHKLYTNPNSLSLVIAAAISVAMLSGMKISNVVFLPLALFFSFFFLWQKQKKSVVIFSITTIALSSLWYLRSFIISGDPISPVLNIKLKGTDPFWNVEDFKILTDSINLGIDRSVYNPITLLADMVFEKSGHLGAPINGYLFLFLLSVLFYKRIKQKGFTFLFFFTITVFVMAIALSFAIRYAYYVGLIIIIAAITMQFIIDVWKKYLPHTTASIVLFLITLVIFLGPSPSIFRRYLLVNFQKKIPVSISEKELFLEHSTFYRIPALMTTLNEIRRSGLIPGSVFIYKMEEYKLYFNLSGYQYVGDTFGKYRFRDFVSSLYNNTLDEFFSNTEISGIIINRSNEGSMIADTLVKKFPKQFSLIFTNKDMVVFKKMPH